MLKFNSGNELEEEHDVGLQNTYNVPVAVEVTKISYRSSMILKSVSKHPALNSSSMTFYNALQMIAFSCLASNADATITVPQMKAGFIGKHESLQIATTEFMSLSLLQPLMVLCKEKLLARIPQRKKRRQTVASDNGIYLPILH